MIPAEAVEAAARAIDASDAEGCGCCANPQFTPEDDNLADSLDINVRALLIAREALEVAAPHMLAGVYALMEDPEHYDSQGPSAGYVSVDNLRAALGGAK